MLYYDPLDRVTMNILTSFPFTFKLTVPGLSNPFTSLATSSSPTTGRNPQKLPPTHSPGRGRPDEPQDHYNQEQEQYQQRLREYEPRPLARPTRPLPTSIGSNSILRDTSLRRTRPSSFSPSPSRGPSTEVSLTNSYDSSALLGSSSPYLETELSPYQQWQQQQQQQAPRHYNQSGSSSPVPLSRKRGWEPAHSSASGSQATLMSTSGYLDSPAKYREMAEERMEVVHVDEFADGMMRELDSDDLPPTKRRRGLAGSIVSTAWSAALIGTAVGLSVYRLWRDRGLPPTDDDGKQASYEGMSPPSRKRRATAHDDDNHDTDHMVMDSPPPSPPPPYEWTAVDYPRTFPVTPSRRPAAKIKVKPATPRSVPAKKMGAVRRHAPRASMGHVPAPQRAGPSQRVPSNSVFDFNFGASNNSTSAGPMNDARREEVGEDEPEVDVEDQMDWLGGKVAKLLEDARKALKTEVVVMSEAREDEVDDGSGAWVSDEDDYGDGGRRTRTGRRQGSSASLRHSLSMRRGTPQPGVGSQTHTPLASPVKSNLSAQAGPGTPVSAFDTTAGECESPEVREMMERARAKFGSRGLVR